MTAGKHACARNHPPASKVAAKAAQSEHGASPGARLRAADGPERDAADGVARREQRLVGLLRGAPCDCRHVGSSVGRLGAERPLAQDAPAEVGEVCCAAIGEEINCY